MRIILLLAFLTIGSVLQAKDRYKIEYLHCYLVGLYAVIDNENPNPMSWNEVVSRPYGQGAIPELEIMVKKWNDSGINPKDEIELERILIRNGKFAFPSSTGPTSK